jgi:cyclohexanone monooxygenase
VTLLDINKTPIVRIVERGVETTDAVHDFDVIIYAIGFDAMTGALLSIDISGRAGISLKDKWSEGPRTYLGLTIEGFPNMFTITGPGSPSVLSNMMTSIEQHVDWISQCIDYMEKSGKNEIEAYPDSENDWMDHVEEVASETLRYSCNSWYVGANIPGKRRIFMPYSGGFDRYTNKCEEVAVRGYEGFQLS